MTNARDELERLKRECLKKEEELKKLLGGIPSGSLEQKLLEFQRLAESRAKSMAKFLPSERELAEMKQQLSESMAKLSPNDKAVILMTQGRCKEAESVLKEVFAATEKQFGPDHPQMASCLNALAGMYFGQGKLTEAETLFRRALKILKEKAEESHVNAIKMVMGNFACLLTSQGRLTEAEEMYSEIIAMYERTGGINGYELASFLFDVASLYEGQGKLKEAEDCLKKALAMAPPHLELYSSGSEMKSWIDPIGAISNNLAALYIKQGRFAEAAPLCEKAFALGTIRLGLDNPALAPSLYNLAKIREFQGRHIEAQELEKRAQQLSGKART